MGQIFKILKKARNKKAIKRSEEYTFFKKFKGMLKSNAAFNKYLDIEDDFDMDMDMDDELIPMDEFDDMEGME